MGGEVRLVGLFIRQRQHAHSVVLVIDETYDPGPHVNLRIPPIELGLACLANDLDIEDLVGTHLAGQLVLLQHRYVLLFVDFV